MYEAFYNLSTDPFMMSPDHRFAFPHPSYARARSYLEYGLFRGEGLVVITGQPGTGKSTVIEDLLAQYGDDSLVVARLFTTQLEVSELLRLVANALGINTKDVDKASLLIRLERFLNTQYDAGRRVLLIIDEAQNLSQLALEELRLLTNIQRSDGLYLQIFLLGQPQLQNLIRGPGMEQLRQRIIASCHFEPLTAKQTRSYIEHRLAVAGWQGDPEISGEALKLIHKFSGGIPRRVNLLCSRLLLYGSVDQKHQLEGQDILQVIEDMPAEMVEPIRRPQPAAARPRASAPTSQGGTSKYDVWQSAFRKAAANAPARTPSGGNEALDAHAELTQSLNHPTVALDVGPEADEAADPESLPPLSVEAPAREEQPETAPARPPAETALIAGQGPEIAPARPPEPPRPEPQIPPPRRPPEPQAAEMLDEPTLPRFDDPPRRPIDAWEDEPEAHAPRRGARAMAVLLFVGVFALTYLALNWYWGDLPGVVTRLETTLPTQILEILRPRTAPQESAPPSSARPEQTLAEPADDATAGTGATATSPQGQVAAVPENWTRIEPKTGAAPPPPAVKEGEPVPAGAPSERTGPVVSQPMAEPDTTTPQPTREPAPATQTAAKKGPDAGVNRVGSRSVISRSLEGGLRRQGFKTALLSNGQLKITLRREVPFRSGTAKLDRTAIQHLDKLAFVLRNYDGFRVRVVAHTDSSGEDQQNLELSRRRARIVADRLIRQGLPASQVSSEGRGESEPLLVRAGNGYDPRLDRRIEVFLIPIS